MGELDNCPNCGAIFVRTKFRDTCEACFKEEELKFEKVYNYIRKRENRTATIPQVVEATEVEEDLIIKFVKTGRLKLAQFPNMTYPCSRCGGPMQEGDICKDCAEELRKDLLQHEKEEKEKLEREKKEKSITYYAVDERYRKRK